MGGVGIKRSRMPANESAYRFGAEALLRTESSLIFIASLRVVVPPTELPRRAALRKSLSRLIREHVLASPAQSEPHRRPSARAGSPLGEPQPGLVRISHHGGKGRGFSPAASRLSRLCSCLGARTVRRPTDCAGRETETGEAAAAAGLKPRPSGTPGQPPRVGEKSGPGSS
jgi:hypothetical protein